MDAGTERKITQLNLAAWTWLVSLTISRKPEFEPGCSRTTGIGFMEEITNTFIGQSLSEASPSELWKGASSTSQLLLTLESDATASLFCGASGLPCGGGFGGGGALAEGDVAKFTGVSLIAVELRSVTRGSLTPLE